MAAEIPGPGPRWGLFADAECLHVKLRKGDVTPQSLRAHLAKLPALAQSLPVKAGARFCDVRRLQAGYYPSFNLSSPGTKVCYIL